MLLSSVQEISIYKEYLFEKMKGLLNVSAKLQ